jgi:hypothetical protein
MREVVRFGGVTGCVLIAWTTATIFADLNRLVQLAHSYPTDYGEVNEQIAERVRDVRDGRAPEPVVVERVERPEALQREFYDTFARLFGDGRSGPLGVFLRQFESGAYTQYHVYGLHLFRAYVPQRQVTLEQVSPEGEARDRRRLLDLERLHAALWRYHAEHGRFPCAPSNVWLSSADGPTWLRDDPASCNAATAHDFAVDGGSLQPRDPLRGHLPWAPAKSWQIGGYVYGYRGYLQGCAEAMNGQFFLLTVRLETLYRELPERPPVRECNGAPIAWGREVVAISSWEPPKLDVPPAPPPVAVSREARTRDARRKADLRTIGERFVAFYRQHGRYPCIMSWQYSSAGPDWIADQWAVCGTSGPFDLGAPLPMDPVNQTGAFWRGAYVYGYGWARGGCPVSARGHYFVLGARLEDRDDPDLVRRPTDCYNEPIPWPDDVFAITSWDLADLTGQPAGP